MELGQKGQAVACWARGVDIIPRDIQSFLQTIHVNSSSSIIILVTSTTSRFVDTPSLFVQIFHAFMYCTFCRDYKQTSVFIKMNISLCCCKEKVNISDEILLNNSQRLHHAPHAQAMGLFRFKNDNTENIK